jgi:hypothetical protein
MRAEMLDDSFCNSLLPAVNVSPFLFRHQNWLRRANFDATFPPGEGIVGASFIALQTTIYPT